MQRRTYLAALGSAGLAGLAGCTTVGDVTGGLLDDSDGYHIGMTRNAFVPEEYDATVGETVVWKNTSGSLHTVTAYEEAIPGDADFFASGGFDSQDEAEAAWHERYGGGLDLDETFEHTFEIAGTYPYYCIPHEIDGRGTGRMLGSVRVVE